MLQTRCWAAALLASITLPELSTAATLHVPADYPSIQACIDAAVSGVDECVVATGTYHETINFLGKAITLRSSGGADVTTIDATGIGGSVVTCASGEGPDTVLDGFTITGGTGTYYWWLEDFVGGGMYTDQSSPIVIRCTFIGNIAFAGGGMYNLYASPRVIDSTFSGNEALYGSGMFNDASDPIIANCAFSANARSRQGGGMLNQFGSNPTVTGCAFSENSAFSGGGMLIDSSSSPTVTNCTFIGNTAYLGSGGGVSNSSDSSTITNCKFIENTAYGGYGGGMYNDGSGDGPTVTSCMFTRNKAATGGGMCNVVSSPRVTNCIFTLNTGSGAGIYNDYSSPVVTNCTFNGNRGSHGGGIYSYYYSNATVTNCILRGDTPDEFVNSNQSVPSIRFSDVQGGLPVGVVDGGGNIDLDPMFVRLPNPGPDGTWDGVEDDYGDLRLRAGSPCINAGDPGFVAQPGETDLEGHARVLCRRVDMGAYEFGIGDYDCNQGVDLTDFASWSSCMTGPSTADTAVPHAATADTAVPHDPGCEAFDFDGDADVDFRDFAVWQNAFTGE